MTRFLFLFAYTYIFKLFFIVFRTSVKRNRAFLWTLRYRSVNYYYYYYRFLLEMKHKAVDKTLGKSFL